ncbi:MAG: NAD(P)-dependent oxidoreductase [Bacillota bacterium]
MRIGYIGLGKMGKPMVLNLLKAGYGVTVTDINLQVRAELESFGAKSASSPREVAAASEIIITSLPTPQIVEQVVMGDDGVLAGAKAGTVLVDMSTVTPETIRKIALAATPKEVRVLDAPVSGGEAGAKAATLTIIVGGEQETFEKCRPILEVLGKKIYHVGDVGAGQAVKLINQLLFGINVAALGEALVLGVKAGIKPQTMFEILSESAGNSYALQTRFPNFIAKGNFKPGFAIDLIAKDLGLVANMAKENNMILPLGGLAEQVYRTVQLLGSGGLDIAGVITMYEKLTGVEVRVPEQNP